MNITVYVFKLPIIQSLDCKPNKDLANLNLESFYLRVNIF